MMLSFAYFNQLLSSFSHKKAIQNKSTKTKNAIHTPNQLFIVFDGKVHSPYLSVKRNKNCYFHFHVEFISVLQKNTQKYTTKH